MELNDSVRRMVRHYPGGLNALAARLGKSPNTLDKEIRGAPGFKLGLMDAFEMTVMCADTKSEFAMGLLNSMAHATHHVLLPMPEGHAEGMTLERLSRLMHECADLVAEVTKAKSDGAVSDNELRACRQQWAELVVAGQAVMQGLEGANYRTNARGHESEVR